MKQLHAYGMTWSAPLLRALAERGATARLETFVASFAATAAWRPDTGLVHDPAWNEAVVTRRLQAGLCLYRVTRDARLRPVLAALGDAASDPARYYGLPLHPPHNHGLMANRALLDLGRLLGWPRFVDVAMRRMAVDIDGSFTSTGHSIEQSSYYHVAVATMWRNVGQGLLDDPDSAALGRHILAVVARADRVTSHLAMPDGKPVPFGDLRADAVPVRPQPSTVLTDRQAGVLTGRWAWPGGTEWYAARFGPERWAHGHSDRMSLVWWSRSRAVLVDPGTGTYEAGRLRDWASSPSAHSLAMVRGASFQPHAHVDLVSRTVGAGRHSLTLSGRPFGVGQTRSVVVDPVQHRLTIRDWAAAGSLSVVLQLDSRWRLSSAGTHRVVLTDSGGARLVVSTTGTVDSARRGQDRLDGGWLWTYPPSGRVAAPRIVIIGGSSVSTVLTVLGAAPDGGATA